MNEERGSASITVNAPAEAVYAFVSDVTRMGEYSPECVRCEWVDGATGPEAGAQFQGWNAVGTFEWDVRCEVREAVPGKVFSFAAGVPDPKGIATIWTYSFEETDGATVVTESFFAPLVNVEGAPSNFPGRTEMLVEGCEKTLAAIKAVVEGS
jgi:uncharacterized protein YndB with AHSA1/START domain